MEDRPFNDTSYERFLNEKKIMGSKCNHCGALSLPPRPICISCLGREMNWVQFKGNGKLIAFTSIAVAPPCMMKEGFNRENPYVVGVVELDEGVKAVARIVGMDAKRPDQIKVGTPLKAEFLEKMEGSQIKTSLAFKGPF
ncbi:MAG: Zn-ribbon domain-containing OB-fold protein [Deltaproteobacteria bacterium]|nr:Zn-ribbon domain-containing OB-fold protein [Deltaproteobacteria bacterium]MBM4348187.1 Zn-ribbon domain-containing OB-fold protein [Deltaproteobacteria bacterium]